MTPHPDPRIATLVALFETLTPATLGRLMAHYAPEARFKDPFNDVRGRPSVQRIYTHMFEAMEAPRFTVLSSLGAGDACMLTWNLDCTLRGRPLRIHGASRLLLDPQGRILDHRDYWDAAEELYARLPVLGTLMRWLRRRLSTPQP